MSSKGQPALQDVLPDIRDGLTRTDRIVLAVLEQTQKECRNRNVPTAMLYGRVLEYVQISEADLIHTLHRLGVQSRTRQ